MPNFSILIIDDSFFFIKAARSYLLRLFGLNAVEQAASVEEAEKKVRLRQPHLVFCKRELLRKEGLLFGEMLKKSFPGVKIVALTTFQEEGDFLSWYVQETGCLDGVIAKENFATQCRSLLVSLFPELSSVNPFDL